MSAANRARGARCEVAVVNYLRAVGWPDARRYLAGDGRQPGDIDWHPLVALEAKDRKESAWPSWCRQATAEAREGMVPAVVRRTRGVTDVGLWECRAPLSAASTFGWGGSVPAGVAVADRTVLGEVWLLMPFAVFVEAVRRVDKAAGFPDPTREDNPR